MKETKNELDKFNKKALIAWWGLAGVSLVVALILGERMHSDDGFVETYLFPQAGEGSAVFFWLFLICVVVGIYYFIKGTNGEVNKVLVSNNSVEEIEADKRRKEYNNRCKKIYNKYKSEGYDINDASTNEIISKSYGITIEELVKLYNNGKKILEEEKILETKRRIEEQRTEELEINKKEEEDTNLYGKDKYLKFLNEKLEGFNAIKQLSRIMGDSYISGVVQARNPRQVDPYIFGGMANGIAGPAAGLATASRIQAENERRKAEGEVIAQNSLKSATKWSGEEIKAGTVVIGLERMIENINEALIIDDINELNNKIEFTNIDYEILKTNNFEVSVDYDLGELKILNKSGLLDGSFKVDIVDELKNIVATGYYNAGNVDMIEDNKVYTANMGLNNSNEFKVICISNDCNSVSSDKKYYVIIEPIHLWMIEKKW